MTTKTETTSTPNFLRLRCPKCCAIEGLDICLILWARLTDVGADPDNAEDRDKDIVPNSSTYCSSCGYCSTMEEFEDATHQVLR
jgi:hypothetical protein